MQNVTAVKFSQRVRTNTDVPLEMFAFAAFGLLWEGMGVILPGVERDGISPQFFRGIGTGRD